MMEVPPASTVPDPCMEPSKQSFDTMLACREALVSDRGRSHSHPHFGG